MPTIASEPEKQRQALQVLDHLATAGVGTISTQVLSEFFVAVTRKIASRWCGSSLRAGEELSPGLTSSNLTGLVVLEAVRGLREHQFISDVKSGKRPP